MLVLTLPQSCSSFHLKTILGSQKPTESRTGICEGASLLLAAESRVPEGSRPALGKVLGKSPASLFLKDLLIFSYICEMLKLCFLPSYFC